MALSSAHAQGPGCLKSTLFPNSVGSSYSGNSVYVGILVILGAMVCYVAVCGFRLGTSCVSISSIEVETFKLEQRCPDCRTHLPIGSIVVPFWDYLIGFYI